VGAPAAFADEHARLCSELATTERHFCDETAKVGIDDSFLEFMADECFLPYNLQLSRAEYAAQVKAQRDKAGASFRAGPDPNLTLVWAPLKVDVSADGTLGYTWGRYDFTTRSKDGKVSSQTGIYLTIWKRQNDRSWKFVYDGSPELPGGPDTLSKFLKRADLPQPPAP
jgi:Domain of unknown function (DUF4440)